MSLILDALNKADREREYRDAVPDLKTVHAAPRPTRNYRQVWIIGGVAAALLVLVALVFFWWRSAASTRAPVTDDIPAEASAVPPQLAAIPVVMPAEDEKVAVPLAVLPVDQEVQALYQTQQDTRVLQVIEPAIQPAAPQPMAQQTGNKRSSVDEELARILWEEARRESQQPVPLPASALPPAVAPKPKAEAKALPADLPAEETLAGHQGVPFLHELPVTVQDTIPTLMYAKHDYEKGFVVINKEELQIGSAARGGVLVERILADGVLLSLNGTEFKLSSLSSWVNY
jgi:general secretion pathway protein B